MSPLFDLVQLADHPGDRLAYRHFKMTSAAAALYPDGVPAALDLAVEMENLLAERGFEGTLRHLSARLPPEEGFEEVLREAGAFERTMGTTDRYSDFARRFRSVG